MQVKCPESFRDDDEGVCQSMINHSLAVRADGVVKGVDVSYESESEFVSAVLE